MRINESSREGLKLPIQSGFCYVRQFPQDEYEY
jgi:hypothetical protein